MDKWKFDTNFNNPLNTPDGKIDEGTDRNILEKFEGKEFEGEKRKYDPVHKFIRDEMGADPNKFNFSYHAVVERKSDGNATSKDFSNYHDYLRWRKQLSEEDKKSLDGFYKAEHLGDWESPTLLATDFWENLNNKNHEWFKYREKFNEVYGKALREEFADEYAEAVGRGEIKEKEGGEKKKKFFDFLKKDKKEKTTPEAIQREPIVEKEKSEEEKILDGKRNEYAKAYKNFDKQTKNKYRKLVGEKTLSVPKINSALEEARDFIKPGDWELEKSDSQDNNDDEERIRDFGKRKLEFIEKVKEAGLTEEIALEMYRVEAAKADYGEAKENLAHKLSLENFDKLEKEYGKSYNDLNEEEQNKFNEKIRQYENTEIFQKLIIKEADLLQKEKIEKLPPEEKGRIRKLTDWYLGLNKWKRLAASSVALGVTGAVFGGFYSASVFGSAIASRLVRGGAGIGMGQLAGKFVDKKLSKIIEKKYSGSVENLKAEFNLEAIKGIESRYSLLLKKKAKNERKKLYVKGLAMFVAGAGTSFGIGALEHVYAGGGGGLTNKESASGSAKSPMSKEEFYKNYPGQKYQYDVKSVEYEVGNTVEKPKVGMSTEELRQKYPGMEYDPKIELAEKEWNIEQDFIFTKKILIKSLSVDEGRIHLTDNGLITIDGLDGEFEVLENKDILWKGVDKWTLLNHETGKPEDISFPDSSQSAIAAQASAETVSVAETAQAAQEAAGQNIIAEIEIKGKINTLSEAVEKALKQEGVSDETKDNFINRWLGDKTEISAENRNELLNKAIRKLSVANAEMGDGDDVQNLLHEGEIVRVNSDGSIQEIKGAKIVSEDQLRQNAEAVKTIKSSADIKTNSGASIPEADLLKRALDEFAGNDPEIENLDNYVKRIKMADANEAANNVRAEMEEISKWKSWPFKGSRPDEVMKMQNESAENILAGKFSKADNIADWDNQKEMQAYAEEAKKLIGDPKKGETMQEFARRGKLVELENAEMLESKILEADSRGAHDLLNEVPDYKNRSEIIQNYYNAINGFKDVDKQADLIRLLHTPNNKEALAGLIGRVPENLYESVKPSIKDGNLIIKFNLQNGEGTNSLIITPRGKLSVDDGSLWGNLNLKKPVDLNENNLKMVMKFINKGEIVEDANVITGDDIGIKETPNDEISADQIKIETK